MATRVADSAVARPMNLPWTQAGGPAADRFQWQSQNKQHRAGVTEQKLARHVELGISVHLFVRKTSKIEGRAAPFLYCGECEFLRWEGDRPITVQWKLKNPVPERWRTALDVPASTSPRS
jgi:hypothetical protein